MVHVERPALPEVTSTAPARRIPSPTLQQVLQHARQAFVCDAASVLALAPQSRGHVLAASESRAAQADRLQVEHGEGPAIRASGDETEVLLSGDAQADPRWSRWGAELVELGWCSVLSTPLVTPEHTLGMLTLYARRPSAFDATHAYAARIFAHYATTALAGAREAAELTEAIRTRHRVNLAQGMLMEEHGLDAEAAFALMRQQAEEQQARLGTVAEQVLAGQAPAAALRPRR
jgi:transcriptional regulator with GAF, ATPase, and Fis domain